jgi:hypothetical protein
MSSISLSQMADTPTTSRLKSSCSENSSELLIERCILVPSKAKDPAYYISQCDGYKENPARMRPTFHHLLELAFQRTLN